MPGDLLFSFKKPSWSLYVVGYHDVADAAAPVSPFRHTRIGATLFEKHLRFYRRHFNIIDPRDWKLSGSSRKTGKPWLLVTFDDGYRSYLTHALPLLKKYEVPSVNFLIGNTVLGGPAIPWDYVVGYLLKIGAHDLVREKFAVPAPTFQAIYELKTTRPPKELAGIAKEIITESGICFPDWFLTLDDIAEVNARYGAIANFGSHTASHANCALLTESELHDEVISSHQALERRIPGLLPMFSFPFGSQDFYSDSVLAYLLRHSSLVPFGLGGNPCDSGQVVPRFNGDQSGMFRFYRQVYRIW